MRGTSIFSLPGLCASAAFGKKNTDIHVPRWQRVQHEFFLWRIHRDKEAALKDFAAGNCRVLHDEHFESLDNYLRLP